MEITVVHEILFENAQTIQEIGDRFQNSHCSFSFENSEGQFIDKLNDVATEIEGLQAEWANVCYEISRQITDINEKFRSNDEILAEKIYNNLKPVLETYMKENSLGKMFDKFITRG